MDAHFCASVFPTLATVTIDLFDVITQAPIALDSDVVVETTVDGLFIWDTSKLESQPTDYKEYGWEMTDGSTIAGGIIRLAVEAEHIFDNVMEDGETFGESQRLQRASAAGQIVQLPDGSYLIKSKDGLKDRIDGSLGSNNSRNIDATDSS